MNDSSSDAASATEAKTSDSRYAGTVNNKQGFIDNRGKIVIEPQFQKVYPFSDGLAAVQVDNQWGFINTTGRMVIPPRYAEAAPFCEGRSTVRLEPRGQLGYIDTTGTIVIAPQFDDAQPFRHGVAKVGKETSKSKLLSRIADVGLDCHYHYIDKAGKMVAQPKPEHRATGTPNERIRFRDGKKWGYVDSNGKVIVKPKFLFAGPFREGLACVFHDEAYGYINLDGEFVIPPRFSSPNNFADGLAGVPVENKKWGFVDRTGQVVIPAKFDWIYGGFRDGLAKVAVAGKVRYINREGAWVW